MSESPNSGKRQKIAEASSHDATVGKPKYPFVNYDVHLPSQPGLIEFPSRDGMVEHGVSVQTGPRPVPVWFSLGADSAVSPQCRSAQYSAVAHSPFTDFNRDDQDLVPSLYATPDSLENFKTFREDLPAEIPNPYLSEFRDAEVADVVSNAVRRDPSLYTSVWPRPILGIASAADGPADLVVGVTPITASHAERMPWQWELSNRSAILAAIVEGIAHCGGDLLIPFRGLILSQWMGGVLFRLSQVFVKVTVVRSQITPRWDDSCYIFCQTRRPSSKFVDKAVKMLAKLDAEVRARDGMQTWGYVVPPVCFTDPALVSWLKSVNAQLIGLVKQPYSVPSIYPSMENLASQFRLKKYVFIQDPEQLIGFYFGSFNPVHENHIALAQVALERLGLARVVFVPNLDGNDEKDVLPLPHRVAMLRARVQDMHAMEVLEPTAPTKRWEAKAVIAEETAERLFANSRSRGQPALLLGQDSWNKAVLGSSRDKTTRHFIGISKLVKERFFIFPRTDQQEPVLPAPKPIRDNVTVVEGFSDPIPGLSSSQIRDSVVEDVPHGLHERVLEYIRSHNLYSSA